MVTLSIGKAHLTFGAHNRQHSEIGTQQEAGALSRFAAAAKVWAEQYGEYKYNETDWRMFRF